MSDDNFSGFVRSGKSHSVSVSQHTGNAKTNRNKVSSDEHEVEARKTEFEKQSVEDKANIQQVNSEDGQDLRQSVAATNSNATRQKINQGQEVTANLQGIKVENLKENNQKIDTSSTTANLQKAGNANYTTNNQGVANNKPIQDNEQKIPNGGISDINQAVNVGAVTSDVQGISKSNIATNKQNVGQGNVVANDQQVPKGGGISTNVQGIPVDGVVSNNQTIDQTNLSPNNHPIPKDQFVPNKQATKTVVNDENHQPVLNGASLKNDVKAAKLVIEDNNQGLAEQSPDANHQHLGNLALSLNMHGAPKEDVTGANRQPTDKENSNDHFEVLSSEKIERAEVDLGLSVSGRSSELNEIFPKIKIKQQESTSATERPLTAQQAAKLKHDKYVEAFRGRLAGIKRGVDELNGRLDVMEKRK